MEPAAPDFMALSIGAISPPGTSPIITRLAWLPDAWRLPVCRIHKVQVVYRGGHGEVDGVGGGESDRL